MSVLECSTGNAGIACAWVSAVKGYACTIVMPEGMSEERKKIMRAYGAELAFTKGGESDVDLSLRKLGEIRAANPSRYWVPGQFDNPDNIEAHMLTTGPEVWEQMDGRVDAWVAGAGTGGTFSGVAKYLKERNPKCWCVVVEPQGSILKGGEAGPHEVEGIGASSFIPPVLDMSLADEVIQVYDDPAFAMVRRLATEEGILGGSSAGANVHAALEVATRLGRGFAATAQTLDDR